MILKKIKKKVKNKMKIGIIGCGGMGNNFADLASHYDNFVTANINFSQKDLDAASNVNNSLKLTGSEGVGKNRNEAVRLVKEQWEVIVDFIKETFAHVEVIAFAFSSSGGSGSGMSPIIIDLLTQIFPEKVIIAMVVIPDYSEVTVNQANCLETFEQLSTLDIAVFPIDNQHVKERYKINGKNKLFETTNSLTLDNLNKLVSYTDKYSKNGNFDKKDLITVLKTKGIATISEFVIGNNINLSAEGISERIIQSWEESAFVPIGFRKVTRAGIIFDGQEVFMDYINHDLIFNSFESGMPLDLFEGNYHESNGKFLTILTGLEWCNRRLNDIERLINSNKDNVESIMENEGVFHSNATNVMTKIRTEKKQQSIKDILSKYKR
jgi:cell division GTPase FtsZ